MRKWRQLDLRDVAYFPQFHFFFEIEFIPARIVEGGLLVLCPLFVIVFVTDVLRGANEDHPSSFYLTL